MRRLPRLVGMAVVVTVLAAGAHGCGRSSSSNADLVETHAALTTTPQLISLPFPIGATRDSVGFGANGFLKLNDGVHAVKTDGTAAALSNAGNGTVTTELGVSASSGTITSVASVTLRTNATVMGDLITSGVLTTQTGTTVTGTITQNALLTPQNVFSWTVSLPQQNAGDVILPPDATTLLAPGSYANVTVNSRAKLQLSAGVYYVNALDVESSGSLVLNKINGAVIIYVRNTLIYRGQIIDAGGPEGDFLLVYLGATSASLEQPFTGTVVAPNASLTLATTTVGHRGTFFAHDIEVHQATTVVAVPFNWTRLFGPPVVGPQLPSDPFNPPRIPQGPFGPKLTPTAQPRALPGTPYGPTLPTFGVGPSRAGSPAPLPEPRGVTSSGFVDNIGWGYSHEALDYMTPPGVLDEGEPGRLVDLSLIRYYKPGFSPIVSAFGAGMFSNYDTKLRVVSNGSSGFNILSFQIANDLGEVLWTETDVDSGDNLVDGIFHTRAGVGQSIRLLTTTNALTPNPLAAATAVLTEWNGNQTVFELVNTGVNIRSGRLQKELDPNANAVTIAYKFAANATLSQLGNDRTKLWQMASVTDNHGLSGTFDYATGLVNGRWCVSAFHAPNGTTVLYTYNAAQVLGGLVGPALSQVGFPDGSLATFSTAVEASTNLAIVHVNDRAADPAFMVKDLYLSQAQMRTASGTLVAQQPNLLRQIVNGAGEVAYANWDDAAHPGTTYVYEGAGTLLRLQLGSGNVPVAFARASFFDPTLPPSQAVFEPVETYQNDDLGRMTAKTDVAGRTTAWERDRLSLVVKGLQFADGSRQTRTFGGFLRLASLVDRNGNVNQYSYDVRGNVISAIAAAAQAIASSTSAVVNARGQTVRTTDGRGNVTDFVYDSRGFLTSSTQPPDNPGGPRAVRSYEYDSAGRMTARVDPNGRRETYTYDARNRLTKTTFPDATTQVATYGSGTSAGLIVRTTDRRASVSTIAYDAANRIVQRRDGVGTTAEITTSLTTYLAGTSYALTQSKVGELTEFAYDSKGRIISSTAHPRVGQALSTRTFYDALGRMNSSSDGYGRRSFFFFDSEDRLVRTVKELVVGGVPGDPGTVVRSLVPNPAYAIQDRFFSPTGDEIFKIDEVGTITRSDYDSLRRIVQKVEAVGTPLAATWQYTYDAVGNLISLISPRASAEEVNAVSVYTYNGRNLISSLTRAPGSAEQSTKRIAYTLTKKKAQITDARGGITRHTYSACCDYLVTVTEPNGAITTYVSDALGNQLSATDGNANSRTTTYDALNRPISSTNGAGEITTFVYDDNLADGVGIDPQLDLSGLGIGVGSDGFAVLETNPLGGKHFKVQDGLGRLVLEKDETGNVTRTVYDVVVNGLVETAKSDGLGNIVRDRSDAIGRSRITLDAEGNAVVKSFDAAGRLLLTSDPTGRGTGCTIDALGRTTSCLDTAGDQTSAVYDSEGNQVAALDGLGKQSGSSFDAHNRPVFSRDRLGNTRSLAYDAASNVTSTTDAEGGITSFAYDARNLRTQERFPDGSTITQEYDPVGRLLAQTMADGIRVVNAYDGADRLVSRTYPDGTLDTFTYDQASRLVRAVSGRYQNTVDRGYDAAGRITSESLTVGGVTRTVTSTYDAAGHRIVIGYPDGSQVTQSYTARALLATVKAGSQTVASYSYDAVGRVLGNTLGNGKVETYSYRGDGTLATLAVPGVSSLSYQYNADKKVTQELRDGQPFDTFGYDADQRLIAAHRGSETTTWDLSPEGDWQTIFFNGIVGQSRVHNAVHEITSINESGLNYDARGQTLSDRFGRTFTWGVDGQLTRAVKTFSDGTVAADYTYDALGRRVTRTADSVTTVFVNDSNEVLAEYDNGVLARSYILGESVDQPIAMRVGTTTYYYSRQVNSSIHAVTSDSGTVVERYEYDAYGFRTIRAPDGSVRLSSTIGNSYGFTGRYHDADIGTIYFRARQYSPDLGRFLNRDNRYDDGMSMYRAYFPPDGTDPTGHAWYNPVDDLKAAGNGLEDAGKAVVSAAGVAADATGGAIVTAAKAVGGAVVYAGKEVGSGAEYLGDEIWNGIHYVGSETKKGLVYTGLWRLGGEFADDVWQSGKGLALAYWDLMKTYVVCVWDVIQFYKLIFTGHPLDALKKLTAGFGNLAIAAVEDGLVFGTVLGGWHDPLGFDPATIIGVTIGLIGWAKGGDAPSLHWHNGGFVYEFDNSPIFGHGLTLGREVNLEPGADTRPWEREHEYAHVSQLGLLGGGYLPAHILSQAISLIASGENPFKPKDPDSYKRYNILETGPYYPNHQPWPNIPRIPW